MMTKLFGASWGTTLIGYILAILTELDLFMKTGGEFPSDLHGWIQFLAGIGMAIYGRITRQTNVTSEAEGAKPVAMSNPTGT
jgi:hypothetical protein